MKRKFLLKTMLLLCALIAGSSSAWATEYTKVMECDLTGATYGTTNYNTSTAYGNWTIVNGANNNKGWAFFKMGGKSATIANYNPCYIYSTVAATDQVDKITVHIPAGSLSKTGMSVNSWGVYVYSNSDLSTQVDYVAGGTITNSEESFDFTPSAGKTWAKDYYYKVSWDLANTTSNNGIVCVDKITLYKEVGDAPSISLGSTSVNAPGTTVSTTSIEVTYHNLTNYDADVIFYESDGTTPLDDAPTWLTAEINATTMNLDYSITANTGAARTAYLKVYALGDEGDAESDLITINQDAFIAVTGVSLDKTSLSMKIGDSETLTPTIEPAEASNKAVTWKSDDESVATVSAAGVVTAVGLGTCTITVTTTDGSFTDNCDVTVDPTPAVTLDFTDSGWGFPDDYTTTAQTYTNGDFTISMGASSNGHKKMVSSSVTKGLIFGKQNATLSLPAFAFNVSKIKVYGISGASGKVTYNVFVGSDAVSSEVTGAATDHEFAIAAAKQAAGNIYTIKLTNDNNCQISKIEIIGYVNATIGATGWATLSSASALDFENATPVGLTAYMVTGTSGSAITKSDAVTDVPGNTGLLLNGAEGNYTIPVLASSETSTSGNLMTACVTATTVNYNDNSGYNYVLANNGGTAEFQKIVSGTYGSVNISAGKAYLALTANPGAPTLSIDFGDANGIENVNHETITNNRYFNLNGQRVAQPTKGLYIVNGKKVIVK